MRREGADGPAGTRAGPKLGPARRPPWAPGLGQDPQQQLSSPRHPPHRFTNHLPCLPTPRTAPLQPARWRRPPEGQRGASSRRRPCSREPPAAPYRLRRAQTDRVPRLTGRHVTLSGEHGARSVSLRCPRGSALALEARRLTPPVRLAGISIHRGSGIPLGRAAHAGAPAAYRPDHGASPHPSPTRTRNKALSGRGCAVVSRDRLRPLDPGLRGCGRTTPRIARLPASREWLTCRLHVRSRRVLDVPIQPGC